MNKKICYQLLNVSHNLAKITGSATAQMLAKAKRLEREGKEIFHLEIGQPDFKPPLEVLKATSVSVLAGKTTYTVSRGIFEIRDQVSKYHREVNSLDLNPDTNVVMTAGAKLGIFASLWSVVNSRDNVIILNPSWVSYSDIVTALGAECRFLRIRENFEFDEDELRSLIDTNTKALMVNSPSNPTGEVISRKNLIKLHEICTEYDILIISDEIYSEYLYDDHSHHSITSVNDWMENSVVIHGLSKTFSMTGFRLGYVLGNETIIKEINKINQLTASCPSNFSQWGGVVAYQHIESMRNRIQEIMPKRRMLLIKKLQDEDMLFTPPKGGIYGWIGIPGMNNSIRWSEKLLQDTGVAVTPGRPFGPAGEGYFRVCFAINDDALKEGLSRIVKYVKH